MLKLAIDRGSSYIKHRIASALEPLRAYSLSTVPVSPAAPVLYSSCESMKVPPTTQLLPYKLRLEYQVQSLKAASRVMS